MNFTVVVAMRFMTADHSVVAWHRWSLIAAPPYASIVQRLAVDAVPVQRLANLLGLPIIALLVLEGSFNGLSHQVEGVEDGGLAPPFQRSTFVAQDRCVATLGIVELQQDRFEAEQSAICSVPVPAIRSA